MPSSLQSRLIQKGLKKTENVEHSGALLLLLFKTLSFAPWANSLRAVHVVRKLDTFHEFKRKLKHSMDIIIKDNIKSLLSLPNI